METHFILITRWNIKFYGVLQASDEAAGEKPDIPVWNQALLIVIVGL